MAGIQVLRLETRRTLDRALVIHDSGQSRPETAQDVPDDESRVHQLGGVGYEAARQAIQEHWPRGPGRKPHEAVEVLVAGAPPYGEGEWSLQREGEFIEACYEWVEKTLGAKSVIVGGWWHRDESSPHLHMLAVPIDSSGKLGWKGVRTEVMERLGKRVHKVADTFRGLQDDFHLEVAKGFGLGRGEVGSQATHQAVDRAKAAERRREVAEDAVDAAEAAAEKARDEEADARRDAQEAKTRRDELHEEAVELRGRELNARAETARAERGLEETRAEHDKLRGQVRAVEANRGLMRRLGRERKLRGREKAVVGLEERERDASAMRSEASRVMENVGRWGVAVAAEEVALGKARREAGEATRQVQRERDELTSIAGTARQRRAKVLEAVAEAREQRGLWAAEAERVESAQIAMDKRAAKLDQREAGIEARVRTRAEELAGERTAGRRAELDQREAGIEARVRGVDERAAGVRGREERVQGREEVVAGLLARETALAADQDALAGQQARNRARAEELDQREAGIEARVRTRAEELAGERTAGRRAELDQREERVQGLEGREEALAGDERKVAADQTRNRARAEELDEWERGLASQHHAQDGRQVEQGQRQVGLEKRVAGVDVREAEVSARHDATVAHERELKDYHQKLAKYHEELEQVAEGAQAERAAAVREREAAAAMLDANSAITRVIAAGRAVLKMAVVLDPGGQRHVETYDLETAQAVSKPGTSQPSGVAAQVAAAAKTRYLLPPGFLPSGEAGAGQTRKTSRDDDLGL